MTVLEETGFGNYRRRVFDCYGEKRYDEALRLAMDASKKFPDYDAKTSFWIACLQSRLGDYDNAVQTLQKATKRGVWWPPGTLQDSDLDSVRERLEFRQIQEDCGHLQQNAPKIANPELMVRVPSTYTSAGNWPALVVFHARYGERPEVSVEEWLSIVSTGRILGAPWSSQVYAWDGRCWDDLEVAEKDVRWAYSELKSKYSFDTQRLVLSGFSQGGALSIYGALKRLVPSRGFVAVAPSDWVIPEESAVKRTLPSEAFTRFVQASDCRGVRGVVIIGGNDAFLPKIRPIYDTMLENGLDGKFLVVPGVGHEYPQGFGVMLRDAVNFVLTDA